MFNLSLSNNSLLEPAEARMLENSSFRKVLSSEDLTFLSLIALMISKANSTPKSALISIDSISSSSNSSIISLFVPAISKTLLTRAEDVFERASFRVSKLFLLTLLSWVFSLILPETEFSSFFLKKLNINFNHFCKDAVYKGW